MTIQNPDYMAHVAGANRGTSGHNTSGKTSRLGPSVSANTSKVVKKRSNTEVPTSSKRSKSEVWVLAGRGDEDQRNNGQQESGKVADHVSTGQQEDLSRDLTSNSSETPRSATTGAVSSSARRRLEVTTPGPSKQRSQTSDQALASGSYQGSGRRSMEGGVTMQVEMATVNGMESITYRVKLTTPMQKVIDKVAIRLGKRAALVLLTRDGNLVDPTAMAAIYTNTKLVAGVV